MVFADAAVLDGIRDVKVTGGGRLDTDHQSVFDADRVALGVEVVEVVRRLDVRVFLDDDGLDRVGVMLREVDGLGTFRCLGDTGHADVILAGDDARDDRVERDVGDLEFHAEFLRDGLGDLDIDAGEPFTFLVFIRSEVCAGGHVQDLLLAGGCDRF